MISYTAFYNFTGNLCFRIKRSAISLEIDGFAYSFLRFHWESLISHRAVCNSAGTLNCRMKLSAIALEIYVSA